MYADHIKWSMPKDLLAYEIISPNFRFSLDYLYNEKKGVCRKILVFGKVCINNQSTKDHSNEVDFLQSLYNK